MSSSATINHHHHHHNYIVDLAIPTFNEKNYIERTLYHLKQQTLYKKGRVHIIIADYKNELNGDDNYLYDLCKDKENQPHVTYLPVFRRGIAYARNVAFSQAVSDIYMNFDADSCFDRKDAIELMIAPILDGNAVFTNCETVLFDFENNKAVNPLKNAFTMASNLGNMLEKSILSRGPGMTISKKAFWSVGGFRDLPQGEDYWLSVDLIQDFGYLNKRFIGDVKVLTSDRRARGFEKDLLNVLDYNKTTYR